MKKVVIIEDEPLAAERLEDLLHSLEPDIQILARIPSVKEAVKWFASHKADLVFLDIQLSDGISFSIFEQIYTDTPIIFTTAYDQYAIKAFQLNSLAYLLKPVKKEELKESLAKYTKLQSAFSMDMEVLKDLLQGKEPEYKKRFLIQFGDRIKKIETSDIAYFYVLDKGIYLKTFQNQSYPADYTLDKLEQLLDPSVFFRINRKVMVHIDSIKSMLAWSRSRIKLELTPALTEYDETIVSIERTTPFRAWLNK